MEATLQVPYRINMFHSLGEKLSILSDDEIDNLHQAAASKNNWFTRDNVENALKAIAQMLDKSALAQWCSAYTVSPKTPKTVGLVMAGNIPLVGFHDLLCVLIAGHKAKIKLSSQDEVLMKYIIQQLTEINPEVANSIEITERLKDIDAVIATGSDNSARYFKHYFGKIPNIIRQNRTSVAVLKGDETAESIKALGQDIFQYYGLGCRNVSKLYIPKSYALTDLIDVLMSFETAIEHHKYRNNYDYNKSIYLVNREPHLDSGFFLLRESEELVSPISVLFYETYSSEAELDLKLSSKRDKIQAIVSDHGWYEGSLAFGTAQCPAVWDYADGVDTLEFLEGL